MNKTEKWLFSPRFLICALVLSIGLSSYGQKEIADQQHSWYMLAASHKFNDHWGATTLFDWRREGIGETWQQSLLRIGAGYSLKQGPIISAGYDWLQNFQYGEQPIPYGFDENRIYEQLMLKQRSGKLRFGHRYRLEQRYLERKKQGNEGNYIENGAIFRQRTRYRLSVTYPLTTKELRKGGVYISASDEIFINFGKDVGKNVLDQNWMTGGVWVHDLRQDQILCRIHESVRCQRRWNAYRA